METVKEEVGLCANSSMSGTVGRLCASEFNALWRPGNRSLAAPFSNRGYYNCHRGRSCRTRWLYSIVGAVRAVCGAAGLGWLYGRMGPALLPITLATLTSDFLVVRPRHEFTLNLTTAGLGATYAAGALLNRIFVCWAAKRG